VRYAQFQILNKIAIAINIATKLGFGADSVAQHALQQQDKG
jgi:hypothetical protein